MNTNFLDSLKAKDDDLQVFATSDGQLVIDTDIHVAESVGLIQHQPTFPTAAELLDQDLVQRESELPLVDVVVQVVTNMFLVNGILAMVTMLVGSVPYWFLRFDETKHIAIIFFSTCSGAFIAAYIGLLYTRDQLQVSKYLFLLWAFVYILWIGGLSSLLQDLAPLQVESMFWLQSIAVFVYGRLSRQMISHITCFFYMLGVTLLVWAIDIYAFVKFQDWITAAFILLIGICACVYNTLQIQHAHRYSVSERDKMLSIVHFYGDVVLVPWNALKSCCCKTNVLDTQDLQTETI